MAYNRSHKVLGINTGEMFIAATLQDGTMKIDPKETDTIPRVAKLLSIGRGTLHAAVKRGEIPTIEHGAGSIHIRIADVQAWSKETRKTGPKAGKVNQ